ncbi:MAG TPA: F0F1 ATP synthase subunit B [Patescibacteria group bacterium]|nr:F0F1 ATP synthase subunit B [Patescibacteria group bacterium]
MEIAKSFGLDPFLFGAQLINFLIVFYLLKRFLYKPVLTLLKKRQNTIEEGLRQAQEGKELFEKAVEKEKEILRKAQETARETIANAKEQANQVSLQIEQNSKRQAERILIEAKQQIDLETKEAEKRITVRISELSVDFLSRALKDLFSEKEQKEVLEKALKELKTN